ncbi:MAG: UvrD-helicase domain-containing protein [Desulfuromonadales bacterium]|nr:UvrD-helicase domain-containing protein [Desulfuromonadales bacterium]
MDLASLNPQQRAAVEHIDGPLLILAGAGSGKTRVITSRIVYLMTRGIPASQILAVTFTNKAAREMRERVTETVGSITNSGMVISTFHSLGMLIMRESIDRIGYKKNFSIYGAADQGRLLRDLVREFAPQGEKFDADRILSLISAGKNRLETPQTFRYNPGDPYAALAAQIYPRYQKRLKAFNAVDFDDILVLTERLLREHAELREGYQERFRYVMVDEYQDTNLAQYKILRLLVDGHRNFCVVGDDDQSIYAWRGANPGNILDFEKDFPGTKVVKLESNYRSTGNILAAANAVIQNNPKRKAKQLRATGEVGRPLNLIVCEDEEAEAVQIVEQIRGALYRKEANYSDFAVLYRTNIQSRAFEEQFRYENVPYVLIGGQQFFDRKEVKDILAYLRVIVNPSDEVNLLRVLNYPKRGIGTTSADRLICASSERNCPLWKVLAEVITVEGVETRVCEAVTKFVDLLTRYKQLFKAKSGLSGVLQSLIKELGIEAELQRSLDNPELARRRMEHVDEVINALAGYEEREAQPTLRGFLEKVSLLDNEAPGGDSKEKKLAQDAVVLMSLHSSKGLEFDHVFLVGLEEEYLPHLKSISEECDVDEERRLCYVGITRARKTLTLTHSLRRRKFGKMIERIPSRFLEEIPKELLIVRDSQQDPEVVAEEQEKQASNFFSNIGALFED